MHGEKSFHCGMDLSMSMVQQFLFFCMHDALALLLSVVQDYLFIRSVDIYVCAYLYRVLINMRR